MDGIKENEAVYGGSDVTDRDFDLLREYRCNDCGKTFHNIDDNGNCSECGSANWEFSPGGVGFS